MSTNRSYGSFSIVEFNSETEPCFQRFVRKIEFNMFDRETSTTKMLFRESYNKMVLLRNQERSSVALSVLEIQLVFSSGNSTNRILL